MLFRDDFEGPANASNAMERFAKRESFSYEEDRVIDAMNFSNTEMSPQQLNEEFRRLLIPSTTILSGEFIVGVIGNCFVLFVYTFRLRGHKGDRYFIPFLALLDLLAITAGSLFNISLNLYYMSYPSNLLCKSLISLSMSTSSCSCDTVLVITIYRYLKICRPHGKQMTLFWRRFAMILISIVSVFYALPFFFVAGTEEITNGNVTITSHFCSILTQGEHDTFGLIFFGFILVSIMTNLIVMLILYISIGCVIYTRFKSKTKGKLIRNVHSPSPQLPTSSNDFNIDLHKRSTPDSDTANESDRVINNFNTMFMVIVIVYILTYAPTLTLMLVANDSYEFWLGNDMLSLNVYTILNTIYHINHFVNPFIYTYFDFQFREEIIKLFKFSK